MKLVIDIGNTVTKIAVFEGDDIVDFAVVSKNLYNEVEQRIIKYPKISSSILSSVASYEKILENLLSANGSYLELSHNTPVPFSNHYSTPETLGKDRIAIASAAASLYQNTNVLVIDIGTCTTYDFINYKGEYHGGAISPGLSLRFRALNEFTHGLPLVDLPDHKRKINLIGKSTEESILSGVVNGMKMEMERIINQYEEEYSPLVTILSGGDHKYFDSLTKNNIFATPNIVVHGLKRILDFNEEN